MSPRHLITLLTLALALTGCAGSVVVEHFVQAEVTLRDEAGNTTSPGRTVTLPRPPKISILFDSVEYQGDDFEWNFGTGAPVRGGGITNRSTSTLCMRFDEARMASNFHPEPVRLIVSSWVQGTGRKLARLAWGAYGAQREFRPPALCLEPGKDVTYRSGADLRELFPTGHLFNTSWPEGEATLIDKGVGNLQACGTPTVMAEFSMQAEVAPRDGRFDWKFRAGMHSFGGAILNRSGETICMRFDEAVLKSNLHATPVPLAISSWSDDLEGKPNTLKWRWIDPNERRYFPPLALCVEPGKEVRFALMPDLRELFPTQKMFNSRWAENDTNPIDKGIGNWIGITLPVDIAGRRQMLEARLAALDSTARMARVVNRR